MGVSIFSTSVSSRLLVRENMAPREEKERTMLFHWNRKATMLATTMQAVPPHRVQPTLSR